MGFFTILILVCSTALSHADCQWKTAIDKIKGPVVHNEIECGKSGQEMLASTALAPRPGREYLKIECVRYKSPQ